MTYRQQKAHEAKIAAWKAEPLPYCITSPQVAHEGRYRPVGKRRFATMREALAACTAYDARHPGKFSYVDYAGAFDA